MRTYGIILAGGNGTRFWPLSRQNMPKQFLNLTGNELMLNETIDRLQGITDKKDIFIVTNQMQAETAYNLSGGRIEKSHILAEPSARNTAACIGYAAMELVKKYEDGIMCILPSDHYIKNTKQFHAVINKAIEAAQKTQKLYTIGMKPTFPATGYGYIKCKDSVSVLHDVQEFVEKPDYDTAKEYLEEGTYYWNSGMFIWKASVILDEIKKLLPDIYAYLEKIGNAMNTVTEDKVLTECYPKIPKISIDYGVMERSEKVAMIEGDFDWNDVGSWDTLDTLRETDENGNIKCGETLTIDTKNSIVYSKSKLISTLGIENLIVVEADDAILICNRDRAQDVRQITEQLKLNGKEQFL